MELLWWFWASGGWALFLIWAIVSEVRDYLKERRHEQAQR